MLLLVWAVWLAAVLLQLGVEQKFILRFWHHQLQFNAMVFHAGFESEHHQIIHFSFIKEIFLFPSLSWDQSCVDSTHPWYYFSLKKYKLLTVCVITGGRMICVGAVPKSCLPSTAMAEFSDECSPYYWGIACGIVYLVFCHLSFYFYQSNNLLIFIICLQLQYHSFDQIALTCTEMIVMLIMLLCAYIFRYSCITPQFFKSLPEYDGRPANTSILVNGQILISALWYMYST